MQIKGKYRTINKLIDIIAMLNKLFTHDLGIIYKVVQIYLK